MTGGPSTAEAGVRGVRTNAIPARASPPQEVGPPRLSSGVPFIGIPAGSAPVMFRSPGGGPSGGAPPGVMFPGNPPAGGVPFGRIPSGGRSGGAPAPGTDAPSGDAFVAGVMPESAPDVVVEPVVQPAVQAKQPSTAAIPRTSRRMRPPPPPGGDSLFMDVPVLVMLPKNRARSGSGGSRPRPSALCPFPAGAIIATCIRSPTPGHSPPISDTAACRGSIGSEVAGSHASPRFLRHYVIYTLLFVRYI
jgi:hypothetical protein